MKWVRLGCALLTTLVASPDGVRYLSTEDVFLQQIVWGFSQLDPVRTCVVSSQRDIEDLRVVQRTARFRSHILESSCERHSNLWILRNAGDSEQAQRRH